MTPPKTTATQDHADPFAAFGPPRAEENVARFLPERAQGQPDDVAIHAATGGGQFDQATYAQLNQRCDALAHGLVAAGVQRGDRVCVFVKPSVDWIALVYALFKLGAVPVLIDPGMGRKNLLACVARIQPRVLIAIPLARAIAAVFRGAFKTVEIKLTFGGPGGFPGQRLEKLAPAQPEPFPTAMLGSDELAAILFTSGSTGPPKGVGYTHAMFAAQVHALEALYGLGPGDVDLACFPLFALFDAALGVTTVLPEMDASRPGTCDPSKIVDALQRFDATLSFGSPAIWRRVLPHCVEKGIQLPKLQRLLVAGAPVPPSLIETAHQVLGPEGDVHTPYGATESLPVATVSGREIANDFAARTKKGEGNCVGRIAPGIRLALIRVTDDVIEHFDPSLEVPPGEVGEVCVRGPVVTQQYMFDESSTAASKMEDPLGGPKWHRMGDLARLDDEGHLWFLGRKSHRVDTPKGTIYPVPLENIFNQHPAVERTALVGYGPRGQEEPVLVVQPVPGSFPKSKGRQRELASELHRVGLWFPDCRVLERVFFHPNLPVDVRHNAKLRREVLKSWVETFPSDHGRI